MPIGTIPFTQWMLELVVQLFSGLSQHGTFILFTSNKAPAELYKNGLNRQYFLPFVKLIQKQLAVVEVSDASWWQVCQIAVPSLVAV